MWEKIKSILTTTKYQVRIGLAVVLIFLGGYNLFSSAMMKDMAIIFL